jgi:hypothetical protein
VGDEKQEDSEGHNCLKPSNATASGRKPWRAPSIDVIALGAAQMGGTVHHPPDGSDSSS